MLQLQIIGSGRVAQHWLKAFSSKSVKVGLSARNQAFGEQLADAYKISFYPLSDLPQADVYLICSSDTAIAQVSGHIQHANSLVAHCAGALPADVLQGSYRKAVVYPLQSFSHETLIDYSQIPFFIESQNEEDFQTLKSLFALLSPKIKPMTHQQRQYLHLAAVFACNFSNHMVAQAQEICQAQQIDFSDLLPLLQETFDKIKTMPAKQAQTGPAVRKDELTMAKHQELLQNEQQKAIYKIISESIVDGIETNRDIC